MSDLDILRHAQTFNAQHNISGFLFRGPLNFVQVLEGEGAIIDSLMASILRDARHTDVTIHYATSAVTRHFKSWSMGYADISEPDMGPVHELLEMIPTHPKRAIATLRELAAQYT